MFFEWDSKKAAANLGKHGIPFEEASTVFGDIRSLTIPDPAHSVFEPRFVTMGKSAKDMLLVVVYTLRNERIRIISARRASQRERRYYEEKD